MKLLSHSHGDDSFLLDAAECELGFVIVLKVSFHREDLGGRGRRGGRRGGGRGGRRGERGDIEEMITIHSIILQLELCVFCSQSIVCGCYSDVLQAKHLQTVNVCQT